MEKKQAQQQVLFVDDDGEFLEAVRDLFGALSETTWQIHTATTADAALEILKSDKISLVAVDVNMPVLDGVQFLALVHRRYPALKKVTLTSDATDEKRAAALAAGADLFIEKPHSPEGMKSVFVMLGELLNWKPRDGFQGVLRSVSLPDVIQMECLGRNSSILEVADRTLTGRIYIEDGRIIHAVVGEMTGEAAFQKLLALPGGSFELQHFEAPGERTIEGQWEFLLMEAARVHDERTPEPPPAVEPTAEPGSAPVVETPAGPAIFPPRVAEMLICSGQGAPLYQWQCADVKTRVALMVEITQQARRVGQLLSLGKFDRLEIQLQAGRAVAQMKSDRMVFVQVATGTESA